MNQVYLLKIYSLSGIESKELEFQSLYFLFDYIKKHEYIGYEKYVITKRSGYVKS